MQPVAHPETMFHTQGREPFLPTALGDAVGAFGHQEHLPRPESIPPLQLQHLGHIIRRGDHEFEERTRIGRIGIQPFGYQRQFRRIARMGQFGADIILIDPDIEPWRCRDRAVGFDLHRDVGQMFKHLGQPACLQQGFPPGDDKAVLAQRRNARSRFGRGEGNLIGAAIKGGAITVRAIIAGEMPRIGRVAPHTGQIAPRQAHKRDRPAHARPFALKAGENLRPARIVGGKGEVHGVRPRDAGKADKSDTLSTLADKEKAFFNSMMALTHAGGRTVWWESNRRSGAAIMPRLCHETRQ